MFPDSRRLTSTVLYLVGITMLFLAPASFGDGALRVMVSDFARDGLRDWSSKVFSGTTQYHITRLDGKVVLHAISDVAASGLYRELPIDLRKTPYMNWSWRVDSVLSGVNEHKKSGDDFPARVYVVVSGGFFFWRTRALNYVFSSNQPEGSSWENPYTSNVRLIAVQSGLQGSGKWTSFKRNVREDFRREFGDDIETLDAVAIMSDTDNSGQRASTYYGNIYFTDH